MDWQSLKKNFNRASTSLLQKTGVVDTTIDLEFEKQTGRLKTLGGDVDNLHKETRAFLDSVRTINLIHDRVASNIAGVLSDAEKAARKYLEANEDAAGNGKREFDEDFRYAVLDPIARYGILFPECEDMIKIRNAKLLDYDSVKSKVRRSTEKPLNDLNKLPKLEGEEKQAQESYEEINELLIEGIPMIIDAKSSNLLPSYNAFVALQARLSEDASHKFDTISISPIKEREIDTAISELKKLSILNV